MKKAYSTITTTFEIFKCYKKKQAFWCPERWKSHFRASRFQIFLGEHAPDPPRGKGPCSPFSGHSHLLHLQRPLRTKVIETLLVILSGGGGSGLVLGISPCFLLVPRWKIKIKHPQSQVIYFKLREIILKVGIIHQGWLGSSHQLHASASCQLLLDTCNSCKKIMYKFFYPSFFWFMEQYYLLSLFIFLCRMEYLQ